MKRMSEQFIDKIIQERVHTVRSAAQSFAKKGAIAGAIFGATHNIAGGGYRWY